LKSGGDSYSSTNKTIQNNIKKSKINFKSNKEDKEEMVNFSNSINLQLKEDGVHNTVDYEKIKEQLGKKELIYEKLKSSKNKDLSEEYTLLKESILVDFDFKKIEEKQKGGNKSKFKVKEENQNIDDVNLEHLDNIQRVTVKQSYDKVLTEKEKEALETIIEEEKDYKKKLELLKRKKNIDREERLERIKKMKLEK
jgi:hypothetical protein